jgi:hypothetical protein
MINNPLMQAINEAGGYRAFARKMGRSKGYFESLRSTVNGSRVPTPRVRLAIVAACDGKVTEDDIIAISGKVKASTVARDKVDGNWELNDDERRDWIANRAAEAARAQRIANERAGA